MNTIFPKPYLDYVFGKGSTGNTIEERAKTATVKYVRNRDKTILAYYKEGITKSTDILTAEEALQTYGWDILEEVVDKGSAIIIKYNE